MMLLDPRPNEWETNGYSWHCACGAGSAEGLYDYSLMYLGAQAHAQRWPTHRVYLDREQRRWVIPASAPEGGWVCECGEHNLGQSDSCQWCGRDKPSTAEVKEDK